MSVIQGTFNTGQTFSLALHSQPSNFRSRRTTKGPENDLILDFIAGFQPRLTKDVRATLFREPALPSGFPDLVVVTWSQRTAAAWPAERATLTRDDLRVLHILSLNGSQQLAGLRQLTFPRMGSSLAKLSRLGMVRQTKSGWHATPLSKCFAVRKIVALEAKIRDWNGALDQATLNCWFASESYILVPRLPRQREPLDRAAQRGIGVWVAGSPRPALRSTLRSSRQPVSLASWLFNEWAWQADLAVPTTPNQVPAT